MHPIFTLQYGEFIVANTLSNKLKNVSVFVPTSAQEKGITTHSKSWKIRCFDMLPI